MPEDRTTGGRAGNLPPETRSFVGRGHELAWLDAVLDPDDGHGRPVTLVGPGGVGKTRLALRAARLAAHHYPDGVWLVELSPLRARGLVGFAVVEALRLHDRSTRPVAEVLCAWLRDKRLLLVLDSCEHVLPDCAGLVRAVLAAAPGVRVLATSRESLGLGSELRAEVDPLPVRTDCLAPPGGPDGTGGDPHGDALDLFAQRAGEAAPGFALDASTADAVAAVCRRLDGMPLAIELAAARLGDLTLERLDERLRESLPSPLDLLAAEPGRGELRHRTLRTAIGWSHELCAPLERLLWARLSVFAGGFDATAAEEVCSGGPLPAALIAGLLERLVEQSIVLRHRTQEDRYQLLDSVREFGGDWLRALGEERALRLRHLDHYRRLAARGCAEWNTGSQVLWCERTLADHANLRAAMDCALSERDTAVSLCAAADIGFLWRHCGHLRDAQHCLDQVLTADPQPGPDCVRALWARGAVALLQGDLDGAARWAAVCATAAREQGEPVAVVAAAYLTGSHLLLTGRLAEAVAVLDAVEPLPVRDDWLGAAQLQVRLALSLAHQLSGDHTRAREVADEVRDESARRGECWAGAFADCFVAEADLADGDLLAAVPNARAALVGHSLLHNTLGVAFTLDVLASAVVAVGDGRRAARLLAIGQRVWELVGRAQMQSPDLMAARLDRERRVRRKIGEEAYATAYEEGLGMSYERGVAYAVSGAPSR
ncbi:ATP-binding protein [Streptomyces fructofermentans]|uniref:NB-ARC domain-containing protein n=1 Tax=Streptomyces fructofermentans TaxID=152141 RepID=A0A918KLN3_9ACTN|nr:NB-ARC domain-containing protein [Streptomyces fructofermentans]GGX67194.1 hypothetical protein GCM10010515_38650 [Streptomyces fructofermentans]